MSTYRRVIIPGIGIGIVLGVLHGTGFTGDRFGCDSESVDDLSAPVITLPTNEIEEPLRGVLSVPILVTDEEAAGAEGMTITVRLDDTEAMILPTNEATWEVDTRFIDDGTHTVTVEAVDASGNQTTSHLVFTSDNTPPVVEFSEQSTHSPLGRTLAVHLRSDASELSVYFLDRERPLYPILGTENTYRALIGIPVDAEVRDHELVVNASDPAGNHVFSIVQIEFEPTEFDRVGFIRLNSSQTRARQNREAIDQANADRMNAYSTRSEAAMWAGSMRPPVEGRITSEFGGFREYSDGRRSHHYGTDYGAAEGTPVFAPCAGTVTLSEEQIIYGNVVILDHGQGVSSSYNHMRVNTVREGDQVIAGQQLGEVGSTGQSTGPHLHWGMNIDGVAVDATQWLTTDFLPDTESEWFVLDTLSIEEQIPIGSPPPSEEQDANDDTPTIETDVSAEPPDSNQEQDAATSETRTGGVESVETSEVDESP